MARTPSALVALALLAAVGPATAALTPASADSAAATGAFGPLFQDPAGHTCVAQDPAPKCKPAAMAVAQLPDGRVLYWDGLEGMNKVQYNVVAEFGNTAQNDQTRLLDMRDGSPSWSIPSPEDGGANPKGNPGGEYLPGVPHNDDNKANDGDLFCSSLVQLADGTLLTAGGTSYYLEPGVSGQPYGVTELEGLKVTHVFDPAHNTWRLSGDMNYGRWYPGLVTLSDGRLFVTSGVTKLLKPLYPSHPTDSGTNVKQTETYDPATKKWTYTGSTGDKSLPLYPRLHLLPDGNVYYDAGGQTYNPQGQSYDEALWNMASSYNPRTKTWTDLGVPNIGPIPSAGFRGSGFSLLLPLSYKDGYSKARVLSAGGVIGVSPGSYLATDTSTLNTIDTANGDKLTSEDGGTLNNRRWYSTGVLLPNGQVLAVNGADRDEVVNPGSGTPVMQAELWNPATKTWSKAASLAADHGRTYHNTAMLLADGSVLIGGHAPIGTGYAFQTNLGHDNLGLSRAEADPTFQIYRPPYFFQGPRPTINGGSRLLHNGGAISLETQQAPDVQSVLLVRNPSLTHLIDADQRSVELRITKRSDGRVEAAVPGSAVVPPGPYLAFVTTKDSAGHVLPSVGRQVFVGETLPAYISGTDTKHQPDKPKNKPKAKGSSTTTPGIGVAAASDPSTAAGLAATRTAFASPSKHRAPAWPIWLAVAVLLGAFMSFLRRGIARRP
ncbi:MAG: hypothetical protein QOK42_752 [Frankiaceae bacterium]|nr:hypothetical protein [Frankiaceae bacterium]